MPSSGICAPVKGGQMSTKCFSAAAAKCAEIAEEERALFKDLTDEQAAALRAYVDGNEEAWRKEEVLFLHAMLLDDLERLASQQAPLAEKAELLRWVFTDPDKEDQPFSFKNCLRVCCAYADSFADATRGKLSADSVRELLTEEIRPWLIGTIQKLPDWIQQLVRDAPEEVDELLKRRPKAFDASRLVKVPSSVQTLAVVEPEQALVLIERFERNRDKTKTPKGSKTRSASTQMSLLG